MATYQYRRHPCEVTSDRLGDAYEKYHHLLTGEELDAISRVRSILEEIAGGHLPEGDYESRTDRRES